MNRPQDETNRVLAQADALMGRHRVFLAGARATVAEAATTPQEEEDIPVLTEVVADQQAPDTAGATRIDGLLATQKQQLEHALEQWMDQRLPEEVLRVMDGISDQLIGVLVSKMRTELLPRLLAATEPPAAENGEGEPESVTQA